MMVIISGAEIALWKWKSSGGSYNMLKSVQYLLILEPLYKGLHYNCSPPHQWKELFSFFQEWLDGITDSMDMDRGAWRATVGHD